MTDLRNPRSRFFRASAVNLACLLLSAGVAFAQSDPALAYRFVAQGKEIKSLHGAAYRTTKDGRIILEGDIDVPGKHQLPDIAWLACLSPDGQVLWSARAPAEPEAASLSPLTTDGDSVWAGGLRKDGIFRFAKFEAKSLRKEASIQLAFAPEKYSSPCLQLHSETDPDFDLQVSLVQPARNSVRVVLLSRELRVVFDKSYTFSSVGNDRHFGQPGNAYLIRLPDRSGYYLCLRHPIAADGHSNPGVGILRLDNSGVIKWANIYPIGYSEFETEPHMATNGAILIQFVSAPNGKDSMLIKVSPDGTVAWARIFPGLGGVGIANASFGWVPYRFTEPYLFATAGQMASAKLYSILLGLNYQTGEIEKQIRFTSPGGAFYTEKTSDSLYASLLNMSYIGRRSSEAALLRFDLDLNFQSACAIRNAEPHSPILRTMQSGTLLFSYSYHDQKMLVAETVDKNLESDNSCGVLQKRTFTFSKSNFQARPIEVTPIPFSDVTVSEANTKVGDADIALEPLVLKTIPCEAESRPK